MKVILALTISIVSFMVVAAQAHAAGASDAIIVKAASGIQVAVIIIQGICILLWYGALTMSGKSTVELPSRAVYAIIAALATLVLRRLLGDELHPAVDAVVLPALISLLFASAASLAFSNAWRNHMCSQHVPPSSHEA